MNVHTSDSLVESSPNQQKNRHRLALLGGLLLAFSLRLLNLDAESLWYDETVSVFLTSKSIPAMIAHTAGDIHPPAYYLLLHAWRAALQPTLVHGLEFLYGWVSVAFGLLVVALLYPVGRRMLGASTALLALWLAAINPFHIWYSQEVRMYSLGAALGLLCLWSLLKFLGWSCRSTNPADRRIVWLGVYVIAAALGLYTLYYFIFLLIALNLIAFGWLWTNRPRRTASARAPVTWLLAQFVVLLLWSPWLPTFWRQATDPPVPGWRAPWRSASQVATSLGESLAALLVGQSLTGETLWPWAALSAAVILLVIVGALFERRNGRLNACRRSSVAALLAYIFAPLILIFGVSLILTPLYHVRYTFTYAAPFMLLLASALLFLLERRRWLGMLAVGGLIVASGWSLAQFWSHPTYASDDHRSAVAELAADWRPGDLILANAGWITPVLETYWPRDVVGTDGHAPPDLRAAIRLADVIQQPAESGQPRPPTVPVVRTGSVDGRANLGWEDPASDFFAISETDTIAGLAYLADDYDRLWHYRLYDTVSDPDGVIREWLATHASLSDDVGYAGRDFLRVQLYELPGPRSIQDDSTLSSAGSVSFGDMLRLDGQGVPADVQGGQTLFAKLRWAALPALIGSDVDLSMSLRLYDGAGHLVAQQDEAPRTPTSQWAAEEPVIQTLALPIPAALKPGDYSLELVVYDQGDGAPLTLPEDPRAILGQRWCLHEIAVSLPDHPPESGPALATFDYIDLLHTAVDRTEAASGDAVGTQLIWRPMPNEYRDSYNAVLSLSNSEGEVVQRWSAPAGGVDYPSGEWPADYPVQEWRVIDLAHDLPAGEYTVSLALERASDGLMIPAERGWLSTGQDQLDIAQLRIE